VRRGKLGRGGEKISGATMGGETYPAGLDFIGSRFSVLMISTGN
jgi:hypothetical protein